MRIKRISPLARITIDEFAERYDLTMVIIQRDNESPEFKALFEGVLVDGHHCPGFGRTEEKAISDYAKTISRKTITITGEKHKHNHVQVPVLLPKP
jgi:hypothetical protein